MCTTHGNRGGHRKNRAPKPLKYLGLETLKIYFNRVWGWRSLKMICRWILVFNMVALVFVLDSLPCNAREVNLIRDDSFEFTDNYRNFVEKHPGVGNNAAILKW